MINSWYKPENIYWEGWTGSEVPDIPDNNYDNHYFVSVDKNDNVIGYISYAVNWIPMSADRFGIISFRKGNHIDIKEYNSNDGCALLEKLNQLSYQYGKEDLLSSLEVIASNPDDFSSDIPSLKKRIKYCKNPMERKSLERQLNDAYKVMKKRR